MPVQKDNNLYYPFDKFVVYARRYIALRARSRSIEIQAGAGARVENRSGRIYYKYMGSARHACAAHRAHPCINSNDRNVIYNYYTYIRYQYRTMSWSPIYIETEHCKMKYRSPMNVYPGLGHARVSSVHVHRLKNN